jgi:beta-hydroxylase
MAVKVLDDEAPAGFARHDRYRLVAVNAQILAAPAEADIAPTHRSASSMKAGLLWFLDRVVLGLLVLPFLRLNERLIARRSHPGAFPPPQETPFLADLERHWDVIRAEADALLAAGSLMPTMGQLVPGMAGFDREIAERGGSWRAFELRDPEGWVDFNVARCPRTTEILRRVPGLQSAMFSAFDPHTLLPVHQGPNKGLFTAHLGVIVPGPPRSCRLRAGDDTVVFEEGRAFAFDDTYDHTAWNEGDGRRLTLFVQVVRPLPWPLSWSNRVAQFLFTRFPYPRAGRRILERLEAATR